MTIKVEAYMFDTLMDEGVAQKKCLQLTMTV